MKGRHTFKIEVKLGKPDSCSGCPALDVDDDEIPWCNVFREMQETLAGNEIVRLEKCIKKYSPDFTGEE